MARLFIDGGEFGNTFLWSAVNSQGLGATTDWQGFTGTYYFRTVGGTSSACYYELTLPSAQTEIYMAFKEAVGSYDYDQPCLSFYDSGGTAVASLRWYRDPALPYVLLRALRGSQSAGTTLEDTDDNYRSELVHLIEIHYTPLNASGEFQVKIDGNLVIDYSGDTTAGLENVLKIRFGTDGTNIGYSHGWDDVVIDDSDWIGNTRIQRVGPTGAGSSTQWDPSTGANYACVDEVVPADTDYVSTNVSGEIDTYACGDLSSISEVKCVIVGARGAYEGSPSPTHQQICIKTSGEYHCGEDFTPSLTFGYYSKMWELNPATSGEWTSTEINALEIGVKATP